MVGTHFLFQRRVSMKRITVPQVRAISGDTPQEAALLFNEAMQELAHLRPKYEKEGNVFWIYYTMEIVEPETLADEEELNGRKAFCKDCGHCYRDRNRFGDIDARKKHGTCTETGERVWLREDACDIYYRERREHGYRIREEYASAESDVSGVHEPRGTCEAAG